MKNGLGNLMARDVDQLRGDHQEPAQAHPSTGPSWIGVFLAQAGLTLEPESAIGPGPLPVSLL